MKWATEYQHTSHRAQDQWAAQGKQSILILIWAFCFQGDKDKIKEDSISVCFLPTPIPHSFHLAGASSSLSYTLPSRALIYRWVQFRLPRNLLQWTNVYRTVNSGMKMSHNALLSPQALYFLRCQDKVRRGSAVLHSCWALLVPPGSLRVQGKNSLVSWPSEGNL